MCSNNQEAWHVGFVVVIIVLVRQAGWVFDSDARMLDSQLSEY